MTTNPPIARRQRGLPRIARRIASTRLAEALATPHTPSTYLELVNPLWSLDERRAVVVGTRRETADTVTLIVQPAAWAGHRAGQWVSVGVDIDGTRHTRCYSVASSAARTDGLLELTVKAHPQGRVSGHLTTAVRPGAILAISEPQGAFALPEVLPDRIVLISGGSGITPVMSMLRTLLDTGYDGRVTFLHYARTTADVIYGGELVRTARERRHVDLRLVFTREDRGTLRGHLTRDHLDAVAPDRAEALTFACGPAALVRAVTNLYDEDGLAGTLATEMFEPPALARDPEATAGTISFTTSGVTVRNDGRTLLEQAEDAGLRPASGCRIGICHTCVRRKPAGAVRDLRSDAVQDACDVDVQLCVNVPAGDVAIDL